ncbi:hypothetical protein [Thalassotalea sediminis]|uniref:hypothetical protein n=1 Tax=Thalassotalea sediminis TaxID=1759089 RepID=UPI0025724AB3|nr:hypothetical protein [Thalassotalea sediminis]
MHNFTLLIILLVSPFVMAEKFIGQWYVDNKQTYLTAHTRDGDSQLHLEARNGKVTKVKLVLPNFAHFGQEGAVFQYSSPTYGLIRTTSYLVKGEQVILTEPFEVHSFVENLLDISTHLMFNQDNLGNSFKDRKITISYLDGAKRPKWRHAKFSTIEIDEVLASLKVEV